MAELANWIETFITAKVRQDRESFRFRDPIVGFAAADDPLYSQLDERIGTPQCHPRSMLPTARTVVVYFLPFSLEIIRAIQSQKVIVPEWSEQYTAANDLLSRISASLSGALRQKGIAVAAGPPTNNYDPIALTACWAHKAAAVIAGIGTFGLHHLIITPAGTAGRLNSLVMDAAVPLTRRPAHSYCLFESQGKCKICVEKCPSGALTVSGFDRFRCNAYLDGKNVHDLQQGCSMCSSGPCAARIPPGLSGERLAVPLSSTDHAQEDLHEPFHRPRP
ncbi:MAG TPA: epoxyqueuosine reductase [Patescibacteria group bacterium]|nr:epoxyqueuosine reductase [Patescibacteria group bacterium]